MNKSLFSLIKNINRSSKFILSLPRISKRIIVVTVDSTSCILTIWLSYYLRIGEFIPIFGENYWYSIEIAVAISIFLAIPIFILSGLYRAIFRYSGWPAMIAVTRAIVIYTLVFSSVITAIGIPGIPRTIGLIQPLLLFFAIGGSRAFARYWLGELYNNQLQIENLPKTLVYGAGSAGRQIASALSNSYEMRVVGYLEDDSRLHGQVLNSIPIFNPNDIEELVLTKQITHALIAIPSASRRRRSLIIDKLSKSNLIVRTLPKLTDLAEGKIKISDIRELDIDDLLGREEVSPNHILLSKNNNEKVVLVSGAGGSIGSELCRQILKLKPSKLILLEINEFALYSIHSELEILIKNSNTTSNTEIIPILASVQDKERISDILNTWNVDTIYHAAAYKHVPLVEHNIVEGIKNNVFGTLVMAKESILKKVPNFVLISTDKAVRPTNIMGASKRLSEMILQALFKCSDNISTNFCMVRFGNVLDSSGSVIPKFRDQIRNGGPITLTHKDVTRFFMTLTEASQLVLQAGALSDGGEVFVLDMGEPVKIYDLANKMIQLSGLKTINDHNSDGDIEIQITGLRPGEKLYEELLLGDNPKPTEHPKIKKAQDGFIVWGELEDDLNTLRNLLDNNEINVILALMKKLVIEYNPEKKIADWVFNEQNKSY